MIIYILLLIKHHGFSYLRKINKNIKYNNKNLTLDSYFSIVNYKARLFFTLYGNVFSLLRDRFLIPLYGETSFIFYIPSLICDFYNNYFYNFFN